MGVALDFGYMADLVIPWQARFLRGLRRPDVRTAALSGRSLEREKLAGCEAGGGLPARRRASVGMRDRRELVHTGDSDFSLRAQHGGSVRGPGRSFALAASRFFHDGAA